MIKLSNDQVDFIARCHVIFLKHLIFFLFFISIVIQEQQMIDRKVFFFSSSSLCVSQTTAKFLGSTYEKSSWNRLQIII